MRPDRDTDGLETAFGVIIPFSVALLVAVNIMTGTAWGPGPKGARLALEAYDDPLLVKGFILFKLGIGAGLFVWYWMANRPMFDKYIVPLQLVALITAVIGLSLVVGRYAFL